MSSLKICTSEYLISETAGTGLAASWFPRIVAERFQASVKDGPVQATPDPLAIIDADVSWINDTSTWQDVFVSIHRAPRRIVTSNPAAIELDDAWSFDIGESPNAPLPSTLGDGIRTRLKTTPRVFAQVYYARIFAEWDDWLTWHRLEPVPDGEAVNLRYQCLLSTPTEWRQGPSPLFDVSARWVRLRLWAAPFIGVIP